MSDPESAKTEEAVITEELAPVTQENPSADTALTPEKRRVKKPLIIGVAVVAIAAAAVLVITVF